MEEKYSYRCIKLTMTTPKKGKVRSNETSAKNGGKNKFDLVK